MTTVPNIPGTEHVLIAFGQWPSFHDAEVINFSLSRGATPGEHKSKAFLDVQVREFEPRNSGTAQYEQVLVKNVIIQFIFEGTEQVQIDDFNFQNVINAINIWQDEEDLQQKIRVEVDSIYGFGGSWVCSSARVESVNKLSTGKA